METSQFMQKPATPKYAFALQQELKALVFQIKPKLLEK